MCDCEEGQSVHSNVRFAKLETIGCGVQVPSDRNVPFWDDIRGLLSCAEYAGIAEPYIQSMRLETILASHQFGIVSRHRHRL